MRMFDYGPLTNIKMYGKLIPPSYDLTKIDQKVHLIAGKYDRIADIIDVNALHKILPNSDLHVIDGGHATFMWAKNITFFYQTIIPILLSPNEETF